MNRIAAFVSKRTHRAIFSAAAVAAMALTAQAQESNYDITRLGLTGGVYATDDGQGNVVRVSAASELNGGGQVVGYSQRFNGNGVTTGSDAWMFDGTTNFLIGLTGDDYDFIYSGPGAGTATDLTRVGFAFHINASGQALGYTERSTAVLNNPNGGTNGRDAWIHTGGAGGTSVRIGLDASTGDGAYQFVNGGGSLIRFSQGQNLNNAGQVAGFSRRYRSTNDPEGGNGTNLGRDAWIYNASTNTTQLIGLIGPGYQSPTQFGDIERENIAFLLNQQGQVAGTSQRYSTLTVEPGGNPTQFVLGRDAWVYQNGATALAGLTGGEYEFSTPNGNVRRAIVERISEGYVTGLTDRYTDGGSTFLGSDVWVYNNGVSTRVGPIGGVYERPASNSVFRQSFSRDVNNVGQVVGTASRFAPNGASLGSDGWIDRGDDEGGALALGLTGGVYDREIAGGTLRESNAVALNDAGQVIGTNARYVESNGQSLGQSGWFFDGETGNTTALEFSFQGGLDSRTFTDPALITESGIVFGSYELYESGDSQGIRAFRWSIDGGFDDLGNLITGGLSASGWELLAGVYAVNDPSAPENLNLGANGEPQFIIGFGQSIGQVGTDVFLLSQSVPEPTSAVALLLATMAMGRRRRV